MLTVISHTKHSGKPCIVIPAGTCGQASGANDLIRYFKRYIIDNKLQGKISLRITGCHGFCELEPYVVVEPYDNLYPHLSAECIPQIVTAALEGKYCKDLLLKEPIEGKVYITKNEIPFFKKQTRTVLSRNESVDPIRITDYLKINGYGALARVLTEKNPEKIISEVKRSGLRGRGGAGFPTGVKWEIARSSGNGTGTKFVVCNADEGDPGAYMDRSVLEGNPHSIIEGMIIAGYAIGATNGIIYVRNEYPLAIKHCIIALRQAHELGLLGENILGTGFSFDIDIVRGAGAFICGEETALIKSIEGKIGEPKQRPPYPTQRGISGYPTCINNVETFANVPVIINQGADEYATIGVKGNTGTKIFSLVGKIKNTGLVEVPMGIPIKNIVFNIGGGPVGRTKIKAVQTGGPSGGCIPESLFNLPIDYDSLQNAGSIMGSGGMIVMDEETCMVDIAKYYMHFLMDESCGKCFTCRKGTQRMYEILDDISKGKRTIEQLDLLEELAFTVRDTTMCGLGQTAPNPVLSTLKYFKNENIEHIVHKKCRAGVCRDLVGVPCQSACPLGTEAWRYVAHIRRGEYEEAYQTIRKANPFPSICARVCDHPCEEKCRAGASGGESIAIRSLKRFITDRIDPRIFKPKRTDQFKGKGPKIAVVGSGPAGLTAAHYLSLKGYKITVFEADKKIGGMLLGAIPSYRLPRNILEKEIETLIDNNITIQSNTVFGKDITLEKLFTDGYKSVFIATGAHRCRKLGIDNEDAEGVFISLEFLKEFNLHGTNNAHGRVGVIGGGNSAIDSARVALRQPGVTGVTILYRRTRAEMPAFPEEIESALEEGIELQTLVSPIIIHTRHGKINNLECIKNTLGEMDASQRAKPVPIPGSEFKMPFDTLIIAIGEQPEIGAIVQNGLETLNGENLKADPETLETNIPGVFAGGDVVTGPNTVVNAIAAGKRAAVMIDRYIRSIKLRQPAVVCLPEVYIEPIEADLDSGPAPKVHPKTASNKSRIKSFEEVEKTYTEKEARQEAGRCLRCDLEFIKPDEALCDKEMHTVGGK